MSAWLWGAMCVVWSVAPVQVEGSPAPVEPAGRVFRLDGPAKMHFEVPTNVGEVRGSVDVVRIDGHGIEGWGRFELRIAVDPTTIRTGDPLRDRHIARHILQGDAGLLTLAATDRLASIPAEGSEWIQGASAWMDARRGRKHIELRYRFKATGNQGKLELTHEATFAELGLPAPAHPFVEVTGPVKVSLTAPMTRGR